LTYVNAHSVQRIHTVSILTEEDAMGWIEVLKEAWVDGPIMIIAFATIGMPLIVHMMRRRIRHQRGEHAIDTLKERYARGEINRPEYEEGRRLLEA
jgi:hypothetical protein